MEHEDNQGSGEIIELFCELCKKKRKTRTADGFCVDCVRYYCAECLAYHTEFLPDHSYQDKKNMPQDVCLQQCPDHADEIIKFYCTSCNAFFCCLCKKKDHDECEDVNHLPQLVCQLEKGKEFQEFKHELEVLVGEISNMESITEREKDSIEEMSSEALSKIDTTRQQFIDKLDSKLDEKKKEVQAIKDKDKNMIEERGLKLSVMKEQLSKVKSNVEQMQRENKRCQLFMAMKAAQSKQTKVFEDLRQLKEHSINQYDFAEAKEGNEDLENILRLYRIRKILTIRLWDAMTLDEQFRVRNKLNQQKIKFVSASFPDVEEQKSVIANQLQRPLIKGDTWHLLDVNWFNQWKSYVGYESWGHYNVGEDSSHPGPIDNTPIFQEGTEKLKEHLTEDLDYVLVPEEGRNRLLSWYGMLDDQKPLPRRVIEEGLYGKSLKIEVYLLDLKLCENSRPDCQISKNVSRSDTVGQLEQFMRVEFNVAAEKEVRLWNRYMISMYEQLKKKDHTVQDAGLYQGQVIVIEQRNTDGTWPRDKLRQGTSLENN